MHADRPFFAKSSLELRSHFQANRADVEVLRALLHELGHRKRPLAAAVRKEVEAGLESALLSQQPAKKSTSGDCAPQTSQLSSSTRERIGNEPEANTSP